MEELTVGQLAARSGVAVSALHFYERQGLISSRRTAGNQRRYKRDALRRVALIRIAQRVGIPLADVAAVLALLPDGRTPTRTTGNEYLNPGATSSTSGYAIFSSSATTSPTAWDAAACPSTAAGWPTPMTSSASTVQAPDGYSRRIRLLCAASDSSPDLRRADATITYVASRAMAQAASTASASGLSASSGSCRNAWARMRATDHVVSQPVSAKVAGLRSDTGPETGPA